MDLLPARWPALPTGNGVRPCGWTGEYITGEYISAPPGLRSIDCSFASISISLRKSWAESAACFARGWRLARMSRNTGMPPRFLAWSSSVSSISFSMLKPASMRAWY